MALGSCGYKYLIFKENWNPTIILKYLDNGNFYIEQIRNSPKGNFISISC